MINDVARAYFNARMDRLLYRELPEEDREAGKHLIGRLDLCLYGIRDAARGWQECFANYLVCVWVSGKEFLTRASSCMGNGSW